MLTIKNWSFPLLPGAVFCLAMLFASGCTPAGPRALLKGERLFQAGKYTRAIAELQRATQLLPGNAQAWNHLGLAYHRAGQLDAALQAYERARRCDLNLTPTRYNLGCLLLDRNDPQGAAAELTTYTLLQSDSVAGWTKLGTAQLRLRQWDAAERSFENALHLESGVPEAWNGLGVAQSQRRRPREAVTSFNRAIQQQANYTPAILNLAVLEQHSLNHPAQALQLYRAYLQLQPASPETVVIQENIRELQARLSPPPKLETSHPPASLPPSPAATPTANLAHAASAPASSNVPALLTGPSRKTVSSAEPHSPSKTKVESAPKTELAAHREPAPLEPLPKPPALSTPNETGKDTSRVKPELSQQADIVQLKSEPQPRLAEDASALAGKETNQEEVAVAPAQMDQATDLLNKKIDADPLVPAPPPKRRILEHLNPATWFHGRKREPLNLTSIQPLPAESVSPGTPADSAGGLNPDSTNPQPLEPIKRYRYQYPRKPSAGNRAKADPLFAEAVQAHRDGRLNQAMAAYAKAIQADPSFFEAHYNLGLAAYETHDLPQSLSAYETALSINPTSVNARYNFALALKQAGYFQDAANELEKLIHQNPDEARAHLALASLYAEKLGEPAAARPHYRKVLELEPQHPQAPAIRYWLAANP